MSSGVFCKTGSSTDVHNSILIDEYHKCIFDDSGTAVEKENMGNCSVDADTSIKATGEQLKPKWRVGMDVRARYGFEANAQYYEAKILRIFDDEYAMVEFYGYSGEQVVKIREMEESDGKEAIRDQIAIADGTWEDECDEEGEEEEEEDIEWEVGMPCRAYYTPMDAIYEATILKVDHENRTAVVTMLGYGIDYSVDFDCLYRSDSSLREKQMVSSKKYQDLQRKCDSGSHLPLPTAFKSSSDPQLKLAANRPHQSGQPAFGSRPYQSACTPDPTTFQLDQSRNIMQPKNENEAIACLLSANYLSGYYAGYYDCLQKVPAKNQQDTSKATNVCTQVRPSRP